MSEADDDVDFANEAAPDETIVDFEPSNEVEEEFSPFSELSEDYKPAAIPKITAADGLPTQYHESQSQIPVLSRETLVCMEDDSLFVTRDEWGDILETYLPAEVARSGNGKYYVQRQKDRMEVQPLRPRCQHYVRQVSMFDFNADSKVHLRLCAARRTTEGTFMSIRDAAMWACSMREPRDLLTEQERLDKFDAEKIKQGKNREHFSIFSSPEDNEWSEDR